MALLANACFLFFIYKFKFTNESFWIQLFCYNCYWVALASKYLHVGEKTFLDSWLHISKTMQWIFFLYAGVSTMLIHSNTKNHHPNLNHMWEILQADILFHVYFSFFHKSKKVCDYNGQLSLSLKKICVFNGTISLLSWRKKLPSI